MLYLQWVFKDKLSYAVFFITLAVSLYGFKIFPPSEGTTAIHTLLGTLYSLLLALVFTCLFKTLKEKTIQLFKEKKPLQFVEKSVEHTKSGNFAEALKTFLGGFVKASILFLGVLGLGAAQFCVFGSPVCTFSVGAAIVTALFPTFAVQILYEYAEWIILAGLVAQAVGLHFMGCFKRVRILENN